MVKTKVKKRRVRNCVNVVIVINIFKQKIVGVNIIDVKVV